MADLFGNFAASPRPNKYTEEMAQRVVSKLLPEVMRWLGSDPSPEEEVRADLMKVLHPWYLRDGFELASALRNQHYWECNSELVEILDVAAWEFDQELRAAVKAWVAQNQISPQFEIGTAVRTADGKIGRVQNIYADEARYSVNIPELGHMKFEDAIADFRTRPRLTGTLGLILPFEQIEGITSASCTAP